MKCSMCETKMIMRQDKCWFNKVSEKLCKMEISLKNSSNKNTRMYCYKCWRDINRMIVYRKKVLKLINKG